MRKTKQKDIILQAVQEHGRHPSAEEVYELLKPEYPKLSLATVYRNLNRFAESGDLRCISINGEAMRFDATPEAHTHALCEYCGQIIDIFDEDFIKELATHLRKVESGLCFEIRTTELLYRGLCKTCSTVSTQE